MHTGIAHLGEVSQQIMEALQWQDSHIEEHDYAKGIYQTPDLTFNGCNNL
jgi:hypothetical protein